MDKIKTKKESIDILSTPFIEIDYDTETKLDIVEDVEDSSTDD